MNPRSNWLDNEEIKEETGCVKIPCQWRTWGIQEAEINPGHFEHRNPEGCGRRGRVKAFQTLKAILKSFDFIQWNDQSHKMS